MNRNITAGFLILLSAFVFFNVVSSARAEEKEGTMKKLIVYYSYTGKTEIAAKILAAECGADTLKIEDVERPSKFKAYTSGCVAARKGALWPIKAVNINISGYDQIFIGAPVWAWRAAPEINTFIDQTDFTGKSVVLFVTMGGSDPETALKAMTAQIEAKGGKVVSSFSIKTGGVTNDNIVAKAKEIAAQYK